MGEGYLAELLRPRVGVVPVADHGHPDACRGARYLVEQHGGPQVPFQDATGQAIVRRAAGRVLLKERSELVPGADHPFARDVIEICSGCSRIPRQGA